MAVIRIFPTQDTYIDSNVSVANNNYGISEILQLEQDTIFNSKAYETTSSSYETIVQSRILMQFDINKISCQISGGVVQNPRFFLNLKTTINSLKI